MSPEALIERMDTARNLQQAALVDDLDAIAASDERRLWTADGATSITAWLGGPAGDLLGERPGAGAGRAGAWVAAGDPDGAVRRSVVWDQVQPLTRFVDREDDAHWAARAADMTPSRLWLEVRRRERLRTADEREAHRLRYLWYGWDEEGQTFHVEGRLAAEQGASLARAIERRADEVVVEDDALDRHGARLADALVELATGASVAPSTAPTLVVHAAAEALADRDDRAERGPVLAETEEGVRLEDGAVRRLACDARVEWLLERDGHPVGIGRAARSVPPWLGRLLRFRDRGCRFPGCERRRWLRAHHIWHWADGGPTDLDNLVLLCHAHHRLVHEDDWTISGHPGAELRFHRPTGAPLRRAAPLGGAGFR